MVVSTAQTVCLVQHTLVRRLLERDTIFFVNKYFNVEVD